MTKRLPAAAIAVLFAMSIMPIADVASAMPIASARVIKNAAPFGIETVQWRGGGWGFGAAVLGGAIIGGILAAPYAYGPGPYYGLLHIMALPLITRPAMPPRCPGMR